MGALDAELEPLESCEHRRAAPGVHEHDGYQCKAGRSGNGQDGPRGDESEERQPARVCAQTEDHRHSQAVPRYTHQG